MEVVHHTDLKNQALKKLMDFQQIPKSTRTVHLEYLFFVVVLHGCLGMFTSTISWPTPFET